MDLIDYSPGHTVEQCREQRTARSWDAPLCPIRYFVGLDLGQKADYTALCLLEKHGTGLEAFYHCRHLHRYALGTSYPAIVADMRNLCLRPPLDSKRPSLAIDATGVGVAVTELFTMARPGINASIVPISIHGGNEVVSNSPGYNVPKRELVSVTQALLQTERLKIAEELPLASVLATELQNFQVEISQSGFDTYNARSGAHDDLVLSLAMALWLGQNQQEWSIRPLNL